MTIASTDAYPEIAAQSGVTFRIWRLLRRLAAWHRHRNYPAMRRARHEAVFVWSAAVLRHASVSQ